MTTEIASTINKHFSSVTQVLNVYFPSLTDDSTANLKIIRNTFVFLNTDAEEMYNITLSFKIKGVPTNEKPSCIFSKTADVIVPVFVHFNY